jgi:hypothetical protein
MLVVFVLLVGQLAGAAVGQASVRRWQTRALMALAVALASAAVTARIASGAVWASPLTDLVWGFDAVMLVETIVALLLASSASAGKKGLKCPLLEPACERTSRGPRPCQPGSVPLSASRGRSAG